MKIFIIIAIVIVIPIILYFSLIQTITDMAYDIAVKNGDDCKLLTEKDLMERYKLYNSETKKFFQDFQDIELVKKGINTEAPPFYCWYMLTGIKGNVQGEMRMTFNTPTTELSKVRVSCLDIPPGQTKPFIVTPELERELNIEWYRCWS